MTEPQDLAEVLIAAGLLDRAAVEGEERAARRVGICLAAQLLSQSRITAEALQQAIAEKTGLKPANLGQMAVDQDALREVAFDLADRNLLLPLGFEPRAEGRVLRVAMANPLDTGAIDEIESTTGVKVEPVLVSAVELQTAIDEHYRGLITKLIPRGYALEPQPGRRPLFGGDENTPGSMEALTVPRHRLEDEMAPDLKLRALVDLLIRKGVLSEEEYLDELKRFLR